MERREGYSYCLVNIDCLRTSTGFNVIMELESSVGDLLPFLAACLPGCNYVHGSEVIDLMDAGHIIGIYPRRITITGVEGKEEAEMLCRRYFERIRDAARRKDSITPVFVRRPSLSVLDILRSLPRTNCGACSSPTCMAFAARVFRREADLAACPRFLDALAENRDLLRRLQADGYAVPGRDRPSPGRDSCRG